MIADIKLYNVPNHQMANRQFVVGDLGTPIKTVSDVKVGNGPILDIALPWDDAFTNANIVKIGNRCYDIVGIDDITYAEKTIRLRLMYNAVTSLLRKDINGKIILNGWWDRCPVITPPLQHIQSINSSFREAFIQRLEKMESGYYWANIVAKNDVKDSSSGDLTFYGIPFGYFPDALTGWTSYPVETSNGKSFMSFGDIISNFTDLTGILAADLVSMSVSPRCPWKHETTTNHSPKIFDLKDFMNEYVEPIACQNDPTKHYYHITDALLLNLEWKTGKLTLDEYQVVNGQISVIDEYGNSILVIPPEYFTNEIIEGNSKWTINYSYQVFTDINSLNTTLRIISGGKDIIATIPGGNLPWVSSAWGEYQAMTLAYDRDNLSRAIENVRKQRDIDMINAVGNSMLTLAFGATNPVGAMAGIAQMGLGLATSEMQNKLITENLYAEQSAKENLVKNSPSQNYQTGYGVEYLNRIEYFGGAGIKVELPAGFDLSHYTNYVKYRGYPCGMYRSVELPSDGYIKGNIYNDFSSLGNAVETDMLRKEIANGCRIVIA